MVARDKISRITAIINGDEYVIKGNAEGQHIEKVAQYVDAKMNQLTQTNRYLTPKKVAVLAAVNIADELFRLQEDYQALIKLLDEDKKV